LLDFLLSIGLESSLVGSDNCSGIWDNLGWSCWLGDLWGRDGRSLGGISLVLLSEHGEIIVLDHSLKLLNLILEMGVLINNHLLGYQLVDAIHGLNIQILLLLFHGSLLLLQSRNLQLQLGALLLHFFSGQVRVGFFDSLLSFSLRLNFSIVFGFLLRSLFAGFFFSF